MTCPTPAPAPAPTPVPVPYPVPKPVPVPRPVPVPVPTKCPKCPEPSTRIEYQPYPVPVPAECPECPECPEPSTRIEYRPYPVPIPVEVQKECPECMIEPGVIFGCIWGCSCGDNHDWEVKLYEICEEKRILLYCENICSCGCFRFEVPCEDCYALEICPVGPIRRNRPCRPMLTLKNVGVLNLVID